MSLIPNKKNKKDNRPGGGGIGNQKQVSKTKRLKQIPKVWYGIQN